MARKLVHARLSIYRLELLLDENSIFSGCKVHHKRANCNSFCIFLLFLSQKCILFYKLDCITLKLQRRGSHQKNKSSLERCFQDFELFPHHANARIRKGHFVLESNGPSGEKKNHQTSLSLRNGRTAAQQEETNFAFRRFRELKVAYNSLV